MGVASAQVYRYISKYYIQVNHKIKSWLADSFYRTALFKGVVLRSKFGSFFSTLNKWTFLHYEHVEITI